MNKISFNPFPELSTERFSLRQLSDSDDKEIFILRSDERVQKFLGKPPAKSIEEARQFIDKINKGISNSEWIYWAISQKNESRLIGTICLWNFSEDKSIADIGFELLPDYWGKAIMREVIPVVLDYGFYTIVLAAIEGEVDPKNIKSIKLIERFGFTFSKELENTAIYSLKKEN